MKKAFLVLMGALIFLSLIMTLYFAKTNLDLKRRLEKTEGLRSQRLKQEVVVEKAKIRKDLDEMYRADMISYQAMQKKVELQKEKIGELEGKIGSKEKAKKSKSKR